MRICVFTGTRADYGLLSGLMRLVADDPGCRLSVLATGTHLAPQFGETWREIEADGFEIDARVETVLASDGGLGVAKSMGLGTLGYADALGRLAPDVLVVLGDRYEALAAASAARVMGIPVAHLHGGEISEGAFDDALRHAITKLSDYHFAAAAPYRDRVIQLGEAPGRVHLVGAFGLDAIRRHAPMPLADLSAMLPRPLGAPYALVTYHPVTHGDEPPGETLDALMDALLAVEGLSVLATYPNADSGGREVIAALERRAAAEPERVMAVPSLGMARYHAALAHCALVAGNSSSGIIEAPAFEVPVIDLGARQVGRLASEAVIRCAPSGIGAAVELALTEERRELARRAPNPYGSGRAAEDTLAALKAAAPLTQKTGFHDVPMPEAAP